MSEKFSKQASNKAETDSPLFIPLTASVRESGNDHVEPFCSTSAQDQTIRRDRQHGVDPVKTAQKLDIIKSPVRAERARPDTRSASIGESLASSFHASATNVVKASDSQRRPSAEPPIKRMRNLSVECVDLTGVRDSDAASHVTKKDRSPQPRRTISFRTPVDRLPKNRREKAELAQCLSPKRSESQMAMHSKALAQAMGTELSSAKSLAINRRQPWDGKTVRVIARLEREGWSSAVVAARVGRNEAAIQSMKRRLQPDYSNLLHAFTHNERTMIWMTKDSLASVEIAAKLGIENAFVVAEYHRLCCQGGPKPSAANDETWDDIAMRVFPDSRCYDKPQVSRRKDQEHSCGKTSKAVARSSKKTESVAQPEPQTQTDSLPISQYAASPWPEKQSNETSAVDRPRFSWGDSDEDAPAKSKVKVKSSNNKKVATGKTYVTSPTYRRSETTATPSMSGAISSRGGENGDREVVKLAPVPKAKKRQHSKSAARQDDAAK